MSSPSSPSPNPENGASTRSWQEFLRAEEADEVTGPVSDSPARATPERAGGSRGADPERHDRAAGSEPGRSWSVFDEAEEEDPRATVEPRRARDIPRPSLRPRGAEDEAEPRDELSERMRIVIGGAVMAVALTVLLVPGWHGSGTADAHGAAAPAPSEPPAASEADGAPDDRVFALQPSPTPVARREEPPTPRTAVGSSTREPPPADRSETRSANPVTAREAPAVPARPGRIAAPSGPAIETGGEATDASIALSLEEPSVRLPPPRRPSGATTEGPRWIPRDTEPVPVNGEEVRRILLDRYPSSLQRAGAGGRVTLWLFVDAEGRTTRVRVQEPSPYARLDTAAVQVARRMEFRPALSGDRPIGVWVQQQLVFRTDR